jgi:hypothetical protein
MELTCSSEMTVGFQRSTLCYTPGDRIHHNYCCKNLKLYEKVVIDLLGNALLRRKYHLTTFIKTSVTVLWMYMKLKERERKLNKWRKNFQKIVMFYCRFGGSTYHTLNKYDSWERPDCSVTHLYHSCIPCPYHTLQFD